MTATKHKYRYDKQKADTAVNFINGLKHVHGQWAGKPFDLMKWQEKIVREVFGTVDDRGYRRYNTVFIFTPKKQAKSELAAALALLLLCADGEYGAAIYGCAADKNQAGIIFKTASQMVRFSPALAKRVKINDATKRLVFPAMDSFYQVVSADVPSKHGINAHGVIIDELLAQPNRELYDVMTKGAGDARRQPLTVILTTAGTDKRSICYEVYSKAKQVIAGTRQDEKFYPVIFEADKDDDWESEDTWVKANPSLGVTFGIEKLREAYEAAKGNPVEEKLFKQLRLNMFEGDVAKWLPIERWNDCEERYTEDDLKGRRCYGGLDLSAKTDLTAFVLVFPPESDDEKFKVLSYFWIPEESVERHIKTDRTPYDRWTQDGDILTTDGIVVNYREVEDLIISLSRKFDLTEIAMDDWNGQATAQRLTEAGLTMIQFRQGFKSMNEPTKELMNHILERRIVHNGNEVLTWNLENMVVKTDPAGNVKPDKEKSSQRIDGAVALIMALDRALKHTEPKGSVYDKRGLLVLNG